MILHISTLINVKTDNWYQILNSTLTGISIVKGFANLLFVKVDAGDNISKIFPFIETVINVVWNVLIIANIIANKDRANTDYKSLIAESIGNCAFNLGGMLEFSIVLVSKNPTAFVVLTVVQMGSMLIYGICMTIAGGIYTQPDQHGW